MSKVIKRYQGCEYEKIITAQDGHKFAGCIKKPYRGKLVGGIINCPIGRPLK